MKIVARKYMQIDLDILKKCAEDDRLAQKKLYEHCFKSLMPLCFSYFANEEDARHILNLGFLKICLSIKNIDVETVSFHAWSKKIMQNTIIDEYRKNKKHKDHLDWKETDRELENFNLSQRNDAESNLGENDIKLLVERLPAVTGKVFMLFAVEGYSHKEIGDLLSMSEGTSKWHLSAGRKMLREWLEQLENDGFITKSLVI
jgi:RNA polymerase sigma-70 factor (ECF subfamily)